MAATTPSGSRYVLVSMSLATSSTSPFINSGAPHAASATCRPRRTVALRVVKRLALLECDARGKAVPSSRMSDTKRNMTCWRAMTLMALRRERALGAPHRGVHLGVGHLRHARHEVVGRRVAEVDKVRGAEPNSLSMK